MLSFTSSVKRDLLTIKRERLERKEKLLRKQQALLHKEVELEQERQRMEDAELGVVDLISDDEDRVIATQRERKQHVDPEEVKHDPEERRTAYPPTPRSGIRERRAVSSLLDATHLLEPKQELHDSANATTAMRAESSPGRASTAVTTSTMLDVVTLPENFTFHAPYPQLPTVVNDPDNSYGFVDLRCCECGGNYGKNKKWLASGHSMRHHIVHCHSHILAGRKRSTADVVRMCTFKELTHVDVDDMIRKRKGAHDIPRVPGAGAEDGAAVKRPRKRRGSGAAYAESPDGMAKTSKNTRRTPARIKTIARNQPKSKRKATRKGKEPASSNEDDLSIDETIDAFDADGDDEDVPISQRIRSRLSPEHEMGEAITVVSATAESNDQVDIADSWPVIEENDDDDDPPRDGRRPVPRVEQQLQMATQAPKGKRAKKTPRNGGMPLHPLRPREQGGSLVQLAVFGTSSKVGNRNEMPEPRETPNR